MKEELLVVKGNRDRLNFKVCGREHNNWSPARYQKVISGRDFNLLAILFCDLSNMGFNIDKAYGRYKRLINEPDLFFLK